MPIRPPASVPTDQREFNNWCRETEVTFIKRGDGAPNGAVNGDIGDLYLRADGGASTTLYVKESGAGTSAGWVAK